MAPASESCWSEQNPDPAVCSGLSTVWLGQGCSSGLVAVAHVFLLLVLWGCGCEEQGSWGSDWQVSLAQGEILYLLPAFN